MSVTDYTENELLEALRSVIRNTDSERHGMTTRELEKALGERRWKVREMIRDLIDQGVVACHSVRAITISGNKTLIPEYHLISKEPPSEETKNQKREK